MTEEKVKRIAKERAYRARCKAFQEAVAAVDMLPDVIEARFEEEKKRDLYNKALSANQAKIAALEKEIRLLKEDESLKVLRENFQKAWHKYFQIREEHIKPVEAAFPDLQGAARWSAASWEMPPDIAAEVGAAYNKGVNK
jgi:lipoate-protein ligase A